MHLLIEVISGPDRGRSGFASAGTRLVVGSGKTAGLALKGDPELQAAHFELVCQPDVCLLRKLKEKHAVSVDSVEVDEFRLRTGYQIHAGRTDFRVYVVPGELDDFSLDDDTSFRQRWRARAYLLLASQEENLYAVLDAARDPAVLACVRDSGAPVGNLYQGRAAGQLDAVAPYLVRVERQSPLLQNLVLDAWGKSWGIFLSSTAGLDEVCSHLQRLVTVQLANGKRAYFRFYDPRVLRDFVQLVPHWTGEEVESFLGPIARLLMEGDDPSLMIEFARHPSGFAHEYMETFLPLDLESPVEVA